MKDILGHKSWSQDELIAILMKGGSYTCPNLPHYRYDRVKTICCKLRKAGLIERVFPRVHGETQIAYRITNLFRYWMLDKEESITDLGALKWAKMKRAERLVS